MVARRRRLRLVITAGPTREHIDSVRFLSNPSSGRMGYAIAEAAARAGHEVTLVTGPVSIDAPAGVRTIRVTTAAEMAVATRRAFLRADAAIFAAAVCDYRPVRRAARKGPKRRGRWSLALAPTVDIAESMGRIKGHRVTIGFALEDSNGRAKAARKLRQKNCDAIVLNGPGTIGSHLARVHVLGREGRWTSWAEGTKERIASRIVREVERLVAP